MARPLRRALIQLSVKLGISIREIEMWSTKTIREYIAVLSEKPGESGPREQTPEEVERNLMKAFGNPNQR